MSVLPSSAFHSSMWWCLQRCIGAPHSTHPRSRMAIASCCAALASRRLRPSHNGCWSGEQGCGDARVRGEIVEDGCGHRSGAEDFASSVGRGAVDHADVSDDDELVWRLRGRPLVDCSVAASTGSRHVRRREVAAAAGRLVFAVGGGSLQYR